MKKNTNCLEGMACPKCGSCGPFAIAVTTTALVYDSGVEETFDMEWEDGSACTCRACYYDGTVADFKLKNQSVPSTVGTTVVSCARCGKDHPDLQFSRLTNHCGEFTHWSPCPTNGEPILLALTPDDQSHA